MLSLVRRSRPARRAVLVEASPLRRVDPRVKLVMSLAASLAVMLPPERLAAFLAVYALLLLWARLLPAAAQQIWRLKWVLIVLFIVDWWLVDLNLATAVTLRVALLASVMALLFATTTPREFGLALERLRLPYRYAFSLGLAFGSLDLLGEEWQAIREAQATRGVLTFGNDGWKNLRGVRELVALTIPAIVLTTKRAWSMTEAAYARGFDAPHRRPYHQLQLKPIDGLLLAGTLITALLLVVWR